MKLKYLSLLTLPLFVALTSAERAHAWGQYGHQQINAAAIELLGNKTPLAACLSKNTRLLKRLSISPDAEWKGMMQMQGLSAEDRAKRAQNDKQEHPLHFFERDAYFANGDAAKAVTQGDFTDIFSTLKTLLSQNAQMVMRIDPSKRIVDPKNPTMKDVTDHGSAPWRVVQLYRLAVQALQAGDVKLAILYLGTAGHYVGDMSMPFHTTLNYDGKASGLQGIHEAVDTLDLPTKGKDNSSIYPNFDATRIPVNTTAESLWKANSKTPLTEDKIISEIFDLIDSGFPKVEEMLNIYAKYSKMGNDRSMPSLDSSERSSERIPTDRRRMSTNSLSSRHQPGLQPSDRHTRNKVRHMPADLMRGFSKEVILTVDERLGGSAALLARLWQAAEAQAANPDLAAQCDAMDWDDDFQSYTIQNYPSPSDYLPSK